MLQFSIGGFSRHKCVYFSCVLLNNYVDQLSALNAELCDVCQVQLYVSDMSNFKLINDVYCKTFSHGPPARYGWVKGCACVRVHFCTSAYMCAYVELSYCIFYIFCAITMLYIFVLSC